MVPPEAPEFLQARGLRVGYGDEAVLHGVDLLFAAGAISVIVGPGGSGKSTLLHALGGRPLGRPDPWREGELRLPREAPRWLSQRSLLTRGTGASRTLAGMLSEAEPETAPRALLERVWWNAPGAVRLLVPRLGQPLEALPPPLGRLAELTAATCRGRLLLLDEPEVDLDDVHRGWLVGRLLALRGAATIVVATHHLGLTRAVADHVLLLCDGVVVESGTAPAFFAAPREERTRRFIEMGS